MGILIQLPNGKTVQVNNIDDALNFDFEEALINNMGTEINDAWFNSVLSKKTESEEDTLDFDFNEDID